MKTILLGLMFVSIGAFASSNPCVIGPVMGDGDVTLSNGVKVQFPGCWAETGSMVQGAVPANLIAPMISQYGVYPLDMFGMAVVQIGSFHYSSSPVGAFREVFLAVWVTKNPNDVGFTSGKILSLFRIPGLTQPPADVGLFVLKSYIDADNAQTKANAIRLYSEVFGYSEAADIAMSHDSRTFKVAQNNSVLFDVRLDKAKGLFLGLTHQYNFDHALIGQNKWARMTTKGYMAESKDFSSGYRFYANASDSVAKLFSGANFSAPKPGQGTSYFFYRDAFGEMHMPVQ